MNGDYTFIVFDYTFIVFQNAVAMGLHISCLYLPVDFLGDRDVVGAPN